eukprot:14679461-Heterocapsa_arctica.AAC.1
MRGGRMSTVDPAAGRDVVPVIKRAAQPKGQWLGNNEVDTVAQWGAGAQARARDEGGGALLTIAAKRITASPVAAHAARLRSWRGVSRKRARARPA